MPWESWRVGRLCVLLACPVGALTRLLRARVGAPAGIKQIAANNILGRSPRMHASRRSNCES